MKNKTIVVGIIITFILMSLVVPSYAAERTRNLVVGEEVLLEANIYNELSLQVDADVLWYSTNPSTVEVSNGKIKVLKVGNVDIVASVLSEGKTIEKRVNYEVKHSVKVLELSFKRPLKVGESINLFQLINSSVLNQDNYLKHLDFTTIISPLKIEDDKVIGVSSGIGRVLASSKDGSLQKYIDLTVQSTVNGISFEKNVLSVNVGEKIEPSVLFEPSNAFLKDYTLLSGNSNIVKVNNKAIEGIKPGITRLTAISKDGQKETTINVNVSSMVRGVELIEDQIILTDENKSAQLNYILRAKDESEDIYNKGVIFMSTSPSIKVSANGLITAIDSGYAQVMIKTQDGNYRDFVRVISRVTPVKITVPVKERPEDIHLINEKNEVYIGEKVPLNYTFEPPGSSVDLLRFFVDDEYNKDIVKEEHQSYYIPSKIGRRLVEVKGPLGLYSHTNYQIKVSILDFKINYNVSIDEKGNQSFGIGFLFLHKFMTLSIKNSRH